MVEQLVDGNFFAALPPVLWQVIDYLFLQINFSLFYKLENQYSREGLVNEQT